MLSRHHARLAFGLLPGALLAANGCGNGHSTSALAPVSPRAASHAIHAPGGAPAAMEVKLVEPNDQHFVVELAAGTDVEQFLLHHDLTLLEQSAGLLLVSGAESDTWLASLPEVAKASRNRAVDLSEGQDLVFGFDEGDWDEGANSGQDAFAGLELPAAHAIATGTNVMVAVLDTGADLDHVHLTGAIVPLDDGEVLGSAELANGVDDDGDTLIDEAFGHGTHVAGIVRTVAPDALLLPIRVLNDDGIGSLWDLVQGLYLAQQYGARVINMSLSLSAYSSVFEDALAKLSASGILLVSAAGNHGWSQPSYPAVSPLVLGVAALDEGGEIAEFSGAGPLIALAAPGIGIMSSYPGNLMVGGTGTSMATPIVSGCLALVMVQGGSTEQVEARVLRTAVPVTPEEAAPHYGRVEPLAALQKK